MRESRQSSGGLHVKKHGYGLPVCLCRGCGQNNRDGEEQGQVFHQKAETEEKGGT